MHGVNAVFSCLLAAAAGGCLLLGRMAENEMSPMATGAGRASILVEISSKKAYSYAKIN